MHAIIFAAPRCGTTSLYNYLATHPQVGKARGGGFREVGFFCYDHLWEQGAQWYWAQFPKSPVTLETTPVYYRDPIARARIAEMCPDAMLIALLRDPVFRAWSVYQLEREAGYDGTFEQALEQFPWWYEGGLYAQHLAPWFDVFPREQIHAFQSERFFRHPDIALHDLWNKMDLDDGRLLPVFRRWRAGTDAPMPVEEYRNLADRYRRPNRDLERLLGWGSGW